MCKKQLSIIAIILIAICAQSMALAINTAPTIVSISPNTGNVQVEVWKTFTCTYSDPNGASNLSMCYLLINNKLATSGGAYLYYNRSTNKLYMKNNAGSQIRCSVGIGIGASECFPYSLLCDS